MVQENDSLHQFLNDCRNYQPIREEDVDRYFEGIIAFPLDPEPLMHAYLWFNREDLFPQVKELILYEKPIGRMRLPNDSKVDFVFLTKDDRLLLVEVKYFPESSETSDGRNRNGKTVRTERKNKRKKIPKQLRNDVKHLIEPDRDKGWGIPWEKIEFGVLSNDDLIENRKDEIKIEFKVISWKDLNRWRNEIYRQRFGGLSI